MKLDIIKETSIEYCENMYALGSNYLKLDNNFELKHLLNELTMLENKIRICNNINDLNNYKVLLVQIVNRIEGIINE